MPRVTLSSPDEKALLRLDPDPDEPWWTLQHASVGEQPAWSARFGARTPVEIIAGLTDALTNPMATAEPRADPYAPLRQAGWVQARDHDGLMSPDAIAHVEHFTDGASDCWFARTAVSEDPEGLVWQAYLSGNTPAHLITGFTRALADQTPLPRNPFQRQFPPYGRRHTRASTIQLPSTEVTLALSNRVTGLAGRQAHNPATATQPPHTPQPRRSR
ncbi:DUF317 domain-containing protein [Streptomyces sp. NPDC056178]|uniref:DUF317 domain-containing protein n=1 Tax=unclassified Streptomyces TaxID=2593676 RepID=UPI0035E163C3